MPQFINTDFNHDGYVDGQDVLHMQTCLTGPGSGPPDDGCADADDEVHRVLTEKVLTRQATVTAALEVTAAFGQS